MSEYLIFFGGIAFMLFAGWNFWFIRRTYKRNADSIKNYNNATADALRAKAQFEYAVAGVLNNGGRPCKQLPAGCLCYASEKSCAKCKMMIGGQK